MPSAERRITNSAAFESSGLPEYLQGSWNNTTKILDLGRMSGHPNDPSKYCYGHIKVISLTQGSVHIVKVFESGCIKCDDQCYRFNFKWLGTLENYVASYESKLHKMAASNLPKQAGTKPGERKRKRNRKLPCNRQSRLERQCISSSITRG